MVITNSCAAGKEMQRTKNQSKYIHGYLPGDRIYRQTASHSKSWTANPPNYQILYSGVCIVFVLNIKGPAHAIDLCKTPCYRYVTSL